MANENILIVEDEELMRSILRTLLEGDGYEVFTADDAENAIDIFSTNEIAVTLTDIKMSGRDGIELLDEIKSLDEEALVIVMTAYSSVDTAVAALRRGSYDYITKPFVNEDLLQTIKNAVAHRDLFRENRLLRREVNRHYSFAEIVGKSDGLQKVFDLVKKVAGTSANVLIQGESGTGKELVARSIHLNSGRSDKPFFAINCGALPESLLESELFGHTKGAFTGAVSDKKGLFRSAHGGTLFLDEVSEMPISLQVKLLRALQEHEVTPIGSSVALRFDARLIAATNKLLEDEIAKGTFREDLYYRLNVVEIEVPTLRSRPEDIPLLARHFAQKSAREQNSIGKTISDDAMTALLNYAWPGNVRELQNVIERAVILSEDEIELDSLPAKVIAGKGDGGPDGSLETLESVERRHIANVLSKVNDDKVEAAAILDIDLSTLYRKLKRYEPDHLAETSSMK